jgi:hypothetical protein
MTRCLPPSTRPLLLFVAMFFSPMFEATDHAQARLHPPAKVEIVTRKRSYVLGETIKLAIRITNTSKSDFFLAPDEAGAFGLHLHLKQLTGETGGTVCDSPPIVSAEKAPNGLLVVVPRDSVGLEYELKAPRCNLLHTGTYEITAAYIPLSSLPIGLLRHKSSSFSASA